MIKSIDKVKKRVYNINIKKLRNRRKNYVNYSLNEPCRYSNR